jgi:hypothetical protein
MPQYWPSYDGQLPREVPKCGFDDSYCDYTPIFVTIGALIFVAFSAPLGYLIYTRE